jgi:hypothetical protein
MTDAEAQGPQASFAQAMKQVRAAAGPTFHHSAHTLIEAHAGFGDYRAAGITQHRALQAGDPGAIESCPG